MPASRKQRDIVVNALHARTNFGALLRQVETDRGSLVIVKRGRPRAILLSLRDYVRLASPEPEVLKIIGQESEAKGTHRLTSQQINAVIRKARAENARSKVAKRNRVK